LGRLTRKDIELLNGIDRAVVLDRTIERARTLFPAAFPPEITATKHLFDNGAFEHVFHHRILGEIGRIRVEQRGGRPHTTGLVAGDTDDPLHAERDAVFKPLMDALTGADGGRSYQGKHMPCARCGAIAASLIFIDSIDPRDFEECARLMYPDYSSRPAPTWIIGASLGDGPEPERAADIVKVWPQREVARRLRPDEFNPICDQFVVDHCHPMTRPAASPKKGRSNSHVTSRQTRNTTG
jgi:hypothetical protein